MKLATRPSDGAWQLLTAGRLGEAVEVANLVLSADPGNAGALAARAMANWQLGNDIAAALADLRRAIALAPQSAALHHNLATVLAADGQFDVATASFESALRLRPDDTLAFYGLSRNFRFTTTDGLVDDMLALYGAGTLDRQQREFLCFGLAKAFDDLGDHAQAIHFCLEANWLSERRFDMDAARLQVQALKALAESHALDGARGHPSDAPVFIVGMPRSGTTLMEAILSRHPRVFTAGESDRLAALDHRLTAGDPARLPGLSTDTVKAAAETFLRDWRGQGGGQAHILTDKTPANLFELPAIARLFPRARVILMHRHPVDCGISNLFVRFTEGNGFAFHQVMLGERIRQAADLAQVFAQTLPLRILDVSYEKLVANPEPQARRVLDFLDLDWDPACLTPEQAARPVQTASQWQVRQPIHTRSVGRWKTYSAWLAPLIAALGGEAWIDAEFARQQALG